MKINQLIILVLSISSLFSCGHNSTRGKTSHAYYDKLPSDTVNKEPLFAVTDDFFLEFGVRVAYLNANGDTIIPFGKYVYLGIDTLKHYANVAVLREDGSSGERVAIDRNENVLYDLVFFDNGPDYFQEGLVRAKRNGKIGFANKYGQIVIPCEYAFAWWFETGKAKVAYRAVQIKDGEYTRVESDEWFYIDKSGNKVENPSNQ